jgi:hypothetical protein
MEFAAEELVEVIASTREKKRKLPSAGTRLDVLEKMALIRCGIIWNGLPIRVPVILII